MSTAPVRIILGHGASGNAASMAPWVDGLRRHGLDARAVDLPRRRAEEAIPAFLAAVAGGTAVAGAVVAGAVGGPGESDASNVVLGGHSFGGRVASLTASRLLSEGQPVRGLVLLSYPLQRPGRPDTWPARVAHWPLLTCPVLLLSGESDPFARLADLREAVRLLPDARLVTWPRVGHGLAPVLDAALDEATRFIEALAS